MLNGFTAHGWKKGMRIRRGEQVFTLLDDGEYVDYGSRAGWRFACKDEQGNEVAITPWVGDQVLP